MPVASKWGRAFWVDLGERTGSTLLYAIITALTLTNTTPLDWKDVAAVWTVIGLPTLLALLKGLLANLASPASGASLAPAPPGPLLDDRGQAQPAQILGLAVLLAGAVLIVVGLAYMVGYS